MRYFIGLGVLAGGLLLGGHCAGYPVAVPPLSGPVLDLTRTLSGDEASRLEVKLRTFEQEKGAQVAVLILPGTAPESIEEFGIRLADQWKLGRKRVDDGVILIVAKEDRTVRLEVGRGLEGAIPDAVASRVINEIIVPRFKAGDFSGGVEAGLDRVLGLIRGEVLPSPVVAPQARQGRGQRAGDWFGEHFLIWFLIVPAILGQISKRSWARVVVSLLGGAVVSIAAYRFVQDIVPAVVFGILFALIVVISSFMSGSGGGTWSTGGGWGSSGGSFGGGGGGYSGGGGSFGGGGASGRW